MHKKIILAAAIALIAILSLSFFTACDDEEVQARAIDLDNAQYRIFFDDFDGELDTTVWNTLHERRKGGYWDKDQVLTENGNLVIRTVEKDGTFYTGAVDSMNKKELLFGYFEARCYLPKASGIWSAFWLMPQGMMYDSPTSDVNVCGAEIDIMESPYFNPVNNLLSKQLVENETYQCAVHVGDYKKNYIKKEQFINTQTAKTQIDIYDDWHTFGLDWSEDYYRFYFDRKLVFEITDKKYISTVEKDYLFLSVEVGGKGGVAQKPDFFFANSVFENPEGTFPVDFLVDYVAVYSKCPF